MNRIALRLLLAASLVLASVGASVGVAAPAQAATVTVAQYEAQVGAAINASRKAAGLAPVIVSTSIGDVARSWSRSLGSSGSFSHNPSYASQIPAGWRAAAENIAYGATSSGQYPAAAIHTNLMNSAGHKANILSAATTHVGVGVSFVASGGHNYVFVTEDFATYPSSALPDAAVRSAQRLSGATRYETAVAIGKEAFPTSTEVVLVAGSQGSVVDGLVAAPFAYSRRAPVLLTEKTTLGASTKAEIKRRAPSRVWVVGGTGVVSSAVVTELRNLGVATVTRLSGTDRYATAGAVAARMPANSQALVVSGNTASLIDAAAASGAAAATGRPILLTARTDLPSATKAALRSRGITKVTVVGGTGVVGSAVVADLRAAGVSSTRLSGSDRYETAAAVATGFASVTGTGNVLVASGRDANLIDAMTGGTLGLPTVLTSSSVPSVTMTWVSEKNVDHLVVVGGTGAVGNASIVTLKCV